MSGFKILSSTVEQLAQVLNISSYPLAVVVGDQSFWSRPTVEIIRFNTFRRDIEISVEAPFGLADRKR